MNLHIEKNEDRSTIVLEKKNILGNEAAEIQNTIMDLIDNGSKIINIDLSQIDYITSWGIGILIHGHTSCANRDVRFALSGVNDKVFRILEKVKLDTIFLFENN